MEHNPFPRAVEEMHQKDEDAFFLGEGYVSSYIVDMCHTYEKHIHGEKETPRKEAA